MINLKILSKSDIFTVKIVFLGSKRDTDYLEFCIFFQTKFLMFLSGYTYTITNLCKKIQCLFYENSSKWTNHLRSYLSKMKTNKQNAIKIGKSRRCGKLDNKFIGMYCIEMEVRGDVIK